MINCIAIDDEPLPLELIEHFCADVPFLQLQNTFTKTSEALKHLRKFPVDLLFLDIQMPDMSGIDFYKSISQDTMVIFTTAHSEYAVEGFNLSAVDYLLKPFEFSRFLQAVTKARDYAQYLKNTDTIENKYLFVRAEYSLVKIAHVEILYIETFDDFLKIHIEGKKPVITLMNLKTMQEKLPAKDFVRVHRSYIVPIKRILSVRNKTIHTGIVEIPIGSRFEEEFFKIYS